MEVTKENKVGYKKTKLGWIPEDWNIGILKDIIDEKRKIRYGIVQPGEFDPNGRYLLRGQDYSYSKGWNSPENLFKVSTEVEARYVKARLKKGDLVMTIVGAGTGYVALIPDWLDGANITQTTARIAIDESKGHGLFYHYYLNSDFGKKQTYRFIKGGAQPGLNVGDVEKFKVQISPLPEQRKIATILSTWDKAIDKLFNLITEKEALKKGLMQRLLTGKKRFPGFTDEWKEVKLRDVAEIDKRNLKSNSDPNLRFKYLSLSDVNQGIVSSEIQTISFKDAPSRARRVPRDNSVLMATVRPNLKAFALLDKADGIIVSTGFAVIDCTKEIAPAYLIQYLFSKQIENQIESIIVGTNYPAINSSDVKKLKIFKPHIDEQQKIASVLTAADKEIETLNKELNARKEQKRGLMQKLLTGEVRVKID